MLSPARRYTVDSSPMAATRAVSHRLADMRSASRQHSKENEMDNGICWEPEIIEKHTGLTFLGDSTNEYNAEKPCHMSGKMTKRRVILAKTY